MKKMKKCIATLIDEKGVVIKTEFMEGQDFFMTVDPEMCKILSKSLDIKNDGKNPIVISDKEYSEYCKLKIRHLQENIFSYNGDCTDWAVYHITRFLNDYLKEKGADDSTSLTEKHMLTIAFAHRLEDKLIDYIDKLEEFNS